MSKLETPVQDYRAHAQAHVHEPVLGVGFMSTAGRIADIVSSAIAGKVIYRASPFGAWRHSKAAARSRDAAFENRLVAVSDQAVYLFPFTTEGTSVQIQGNPQVWPRGSFRVTIDAPGRLTQTLHFDLADGTHHDAEVYRGRAYDELTLPLLDLLTAASAGC